MDAITLQSLKKTYRIGVGRARVREMLPTPFDAIARAVAPKWWFRDTFNAVDDLTFSVASGSSVGIVGHNGAGKTTLLKLIAGVTAPTSGTVRAHGRVSALIDVVVGLHPDLTGRENVQLLGAMHGFGRKAMRERIDRIVEFAEIDDLIDTPLKRCSAGMITRIGFGAITAFDADVLLIDEVLSVGDAVFQRKCAGWLERYAADGGTLLFVSHNLALVRSMTERVVWLDHGRLVADGPTSDVLLEYGRAMERRDAPQDTGAKGQVRKLMLSRGMNRWGSGGARLDQVHIGEVGERGDLSVQISFENVELDHGMFAVGFVDERGVEIGAAASPVIQVPRPGGEIACQIDRVPLRTGIYFPVISILSQDGLVRDRWQLDRAVVVDSNGASGTGETLGPFEIAAAWRSANNGNGHPQSRSRDDDTPPAVLDVRE
jgi:ABC-type polysaccharide/polyol phosphate transport system ATPase subunit